MARLLSLVVVTLAFICAACGSDHARTRAECEAVIARKGGVRIVLEVDDSGLTADRKEGVVERVAEIIRDRVARFGIHKPWIQREGAKQIIVLLPGLVDDERAGALIGRTAMLEFRLALPDDQYAPVLQDLDRALKTIEVTPGAGSEDHPLASRLLAFNGTLFVDERDKEAVELLLSTPQAKAVIPGELTFLWGAQATELSESTGGRQLYLLESKPALTGAHVVETNVQPNRDIPSTFDVTFQLDREGAAVFERLTGDNIGRRIAIVLDDMVSTAPIVQSRIPGGRGSITASFTIQKAQDLAIILRSGAFPVPVRMVEARSLSSTSSENDSRIQAASREEPVASPRTNEGPARLLADEEYVDPKGFFALTPPDSWKVTEYPEDPRGKVAFLRSGTTDLRILTGGVDYSGISKLESELRGISVRTGIEMNLGRIVFNGIPAIERKFVHRGSRILMIDFVHGNVSHNLMYTAPLNRFEESLAQIEASLATYQPIDKNMSEEEALEGHLAKCRRLGRLLIDQGSYEEAGIYIEDGLAQSGRDSLLLQLQDELAETSSN